MIHGQTTSLETVIASEAKQSILPRKERMDCFAALAMTANRKSKQPRPRDAKRARGVAESSAMTGSN